ncbi:hypothetical protein QFC19_007120 [Naganishia cerealis]|uniref:Uncharacterized protein n=1 Tax=Naganishia cerealis TaxID=610337 RepID=A0ACC2VBZ2_9TREE|nr:hypothetical protein QFC19_007120 [Naganishia cerealis]
MSFRPWHPLTWLVQPPDSCNHDDWKILNTLAENHLPKAAHEKLQDVLHRYKRHVAMLRKGVPMVLEEESDEIIKERWAKVTEEDLLWGWLNG